MGFTEEDKSVIKFLRQNKHYGAQRLLKEFPDKGWTLGGLHYLLQKIDKTGTVERRKGTGGVRTVLTDDNINTVNELLQSQGGCLSQRQIARHIGVSQRSVGKIIRNELKLKCFKRHRATSELTERNKESRVALCHDLLCLFPEHKASFIFFTGEKLFTIAGPAIPSNEGQVVTGMKSKCSKSVMVSVGVSLLGRTGIHFVDPGTNKIDGDYYRNELLMKCLLPDMREISELFIFQQDGTPAHRAAETVALLSQQTPEFIEPNLWPPKSPDLNPVHYGIWGVLQESVYRKKIGNVDELRQRIKQAWDELEQRTIDRAVKTWRTRLCACVAADGGQFDYQLK